ncbi:MAG: hypothetical protein ACO3PV_08490, partial [Pseudohongiellaceae bacterium]
MTVPRQKNRAASADFKSSDRRVWTIIRRLPILPQNLRFLQLEPPMIVPPYEIRSARHAAGKGVFR